MDVWHACMTDILPEMVVPFENSDMGSLHVFHQLLVGSLDFLFFIFFLLAWKEQTLESLKVEMDKKIVSSCEPSSITYRRVIRIQII